MEISEVFEEVSNKMRSDLKQTRAALKHPGLKGSAVEEIFREFLRKYLPRSLDISTGILVDANGNTSRQLDIIISDMAKTPILYESGDNRVIPVECVYAVIEVKSKLNSQELEKAFKNMLSVRDLKKTAYYVENSVISHTKNLYGEEWDIWPVNYFIFAFDMTNSDALGKKLDYMHNEKPLPMWSRIDSICILNEGAMCNHHVESDKFSALPEPGSRLVWSPTDKSLLLFYTLVSHFLNQADMPNFRFNDYVKHLNF